MADTESILDSVKKVLGLDIEYDAFDVDVVMLINSAFATLNQLGLGPKSGFSINDREEKWGDFIEDTENINSVKTYVAISVRLIFDPPATSFVITAMETRLKELEWRLNVQVDSTPIPLVPVFLEPQL